MAKKRRPQGKKAAPRAAAPVAIAVAAAPKPPPVEAPAFWFGYEVAWSKLLVARFVIFGLLAVDALLQINHAPRYGAGGFNVAHLPLLDALGPGRAGYAIGQLAVGYLLVLAALGVGMRVVLPAATAIYAWLYFGSQLDSYQHHYLVALVLLIACFVPWERPAEARPATPVRAWAIRLLLVQLGIMYLWAAISKLDAAWMDGRTLELQMAGTMRELVDDTVGIAAASRFTVLVELALALVVWWRRAWFVALPLGLAFHASILASGLEIGLFAVLMLGFYVLVVPDRAFVAIGERVERHAGGVLRAAGGALSHWIVVFAALGVGVAAALIVRLPYAVPLGLGLAGACAGLAGYTRDRIFSTRLARAHLVALLVWFGVDRATQTAFDYYRFWGGNAGRLGDPATSEHAYRKAIEVAPDEGGGHYQLGKLLLARGAEDEGLAALRQAQYLEPGRARAFLAEARHLHGKGRRDDALAKAREATFAQPDHTEAQQFLASLTAGTAGTAPAAETDE